MEGDILPGIPLSGDLLLHILESTLGHTDVPVSCVVGVPSQEALCCEVCRFPDSAREMLPLSRISQEPDAGLLVDSRSIQSYYPTTMFEAIFAKLTPGEIKELQILSDKAKLATAEFEDILEFQTALKNEVNKDTKKAIDKARDKKLKAQRAKITAYKALGFDHRRFWQFDNLSRGLCRLCAAPDDSDEKDGKKRGICNKCRMKQPKP